MNKTIVQQDWPITRISLATYLSFVLLLPVCSKANEAELVFTPQEMQRWTQKSFVDYTDYRLIENRLTEQTESADLDRFVLSAKAHGQASALYHETTVDLTQTPYLQWRWRVDRKLTITDAHQKDQDDYPARIYVVIKEGIFPWQIRSLNYVWASHQPNEKFWSNPYTGRAVMIPLRNGTDSLRQWVSEKVNLAEDYQRVFGRTITEIHGIAIMTDADNTGGEAHAYYDSLMFTTD